MSTLLEIEFHHPYQTEVKPLVLQWQLLETEAASLWFRSLYQSLKKKQAFYGRFTGFENSPKDLNYLSEKMNKAIEVINLEGEYPEIKERADGTFSQEFANVMHHHFELLFGDAKDPSVHFKNSSSVAKAAISIINHCVHDMEAYCRAQEFQDSSRAVVFEILDRQQFSLPSFLNKDFTFDLEFGDICLHYGLVGKTWWEVFLDEDEEIFEDGIRPLDVIGPEFDIHFHSKKIERHTLEKFYQFLKDNKQDPLDPQLRLGFLPVAKLLEGELKDPREVYRQVGERSGVKRMTLIEREEELVSVDFSMNNIINEGFLKINSHKVLKKGDRLQTHGFPTEAFIISGEESNTRLNLSLTQGDMIQEGHAIALYVSEAGHSIVLPASEARRGLSAGEDYVIKPGEYVCLLYDGENSYRLLPNAPFRTKGAL